MNDSSGAVSAADRHRHRGLDRLVDRLAARLWGRRKRHGVLFVFTLGRGDLMLFSHVAERFRPLLEPGERADILLREGVRGAAFVLPDWLGVLSLPALGFQRRFRPRLKWSLRMARGRYRRAIVFDTQWSPLRDERLAELAAGDVPDCAILFPEADKRRGALRERLGRARYLLNEESRHCLDVWAEFAAGLTGVPAAPVSPRFDPARLPPPRRGARPHVVLHPFPSFASKYFGPEVYAPLLAALAGSHDVLVSAGPGDFGKYPAMRGLLDQPHVRVADEPLEAMAALVRGADLVVSVDTALAHLGIGCGAPTLVIHNTDDPGVYMPYPEHLCPADARFLEVGPAAGAERRGWSPNRPWEAPADTGERVRAAALELLGGAGGG